MNLITLRYDGVQEGMKPCEDNLQFTVLSHYIGDDGRDYFGSSWIGVFSLLKIGINLDQCVVINRE